MTWIVAGAAGLAAAEFAAGGAAAATGVAATSAIGAGVAAGTLAASAWSLSAILSTAQLAWSVSSTLFSMFQGANQSMTGPRLKDAHIQSAAFGSPIKRFWGVDRMAGNLIWIGSDGHGGRGIRTHSHEIGGKGKGGASGNTFTYFADFAVAINGASNCRGVIRIWAGPKLIYDHSMDASLQSLVGSGQNLEGNGGLVTFYDGNEEQLPPALIEAFEGVGNTTAYRNQFLAVFSDFETTEYGTIPNLSFECYTDGDEGFQEKGYWQMTDYGLASGSLGSWSYVDPNGEIWMMVGHGNANYTSTSPDGPLPIPGNEGEHYIRAFRLLSDQSIIQEERPAAVFTDNTSPSSFGGQMATGVSDEPAALFASGGTAWLVRPGKIITTINSPAGYEFFTKKGTDLYLMASGSWTQGLARYSADSGALIAAVTDKAAFYAQTGLITSIVMGDDYLWALHPVQFNAFGNINSHAKLFKINPETMTISASYDLGVNKVRNFFVENDTRIRLFGTGQVTGVAFWDWEDGEITFLGSSTTPHGNAGLEGTLFVRNGIWYTGQFGYWGTYDFNVHAWAPGAEGLCCPLWKIQRDICIACGMEENEFNVSELNDCVRGYTLDQQMTGRDATLPLQRYAFYDGPESDNVLYFRKRGHNAVATILQGDCAARPDLNAVLPPVQEITRAQESELPVIVHVRYKDQDASYQTGHVVSSGRLNSESKNVVTVDLAIVMTSTKAKQIAEVLSATHWLERDPRVLMLSRKHVALDAADPVTLRVAA